MSRLTPADHDALPVREFAFPWSRKEPIEHTAHVRATVERFRQVLDVIDAERDEAWARIRAAARRFDVELHEEHWRDL